MLRGRQAVVCDSCRAGTICIICELVDMRSLGLLAVTAFAVIILAVVVYPYFSQSGPALRPGGWGAAPILSTGTGAKSCWSTCGLRGALLAAARRPRSSNCIRRTARGG